MKIPKLQSKCKKQLSLGFLIQPNEKTFIFRPKTWVTLLYLFTIAIALCLHLFKKNLLVNNDLSGMYGTEISLHISNFSISYILILAAGYIWLLYGSPLYWVYIFTVLVIAVNFIYELFLPLLNTPDILDAFYGLPGSVLACIVLVLIKQKGLVPKN